MMKELLAAGMIHGDAMTCECYQATRVELRSIRFGLGCSFLYYGVPQHTDSVSICVSVCVCLSLSLSPIHRQEHQDNLHRVGQRALEDSQQGLEQQRKYVYPCRGPLHPFSPTPSPSSETWNDSIGSRKSRHWGTSVER